MSDITKCPNCGGDVWDNRARKAGGKMNPKAPDYSCKDKEGCKWVLWPPRGAKSNGTPAKVAGPKWTWAQLQDLSAKCLKIAAKQVPAAVGASTSEDAVKWAATLFITAARDGVAPPPQALDEKPKAVVEVEKEQDDDLPW